MPKNSFFCRTGRPWNGSQGGGGARRNGNPTRRFGRAPGGAWSENSSRVPPLVLSITEPVSLQNVVRGTHQRPLRPHLCQAPRLLDLPEHRFPNRLARRVDRRPRLRLRFDFAHRPEPVEGQFPFHPLHPRRSLEAARAGRPAAPRAAAVPSSERRTSGNAPPRRRPSRLPPALHAAAHRTDAPPFAVERQPRSTPLPAVPVVCGSHGHVAIGQLPLRPHKHLLPKSHSPVHFHHGLLVEMENRITTDHVIVGFGFQHRLGNRYLVIGKVLDR